MSTFLECCRQIERVAERLFEGEEPVLHVMGEQIASEKRRNPWTCGQGGPSSASTQLRKYNIAASDGLFGLKIASFA